MGNNNNQSPQVVQELKELSIALEEAKKKCDRVVFTISDPQIRKFILGLEQQSIRYAVELNAQIQNLGGEFPYVQQEIPPVTGLLNRQANNIEKEVLQICRRIGDSLIKLYSNVLKNSIMNDGLKQMIRSQMNGIMSSTLHLKLLGKLLYSE